MIFNSVVLLENMITSAIFVSYPTALNLTLYSPVEYSVILYLPFSSAPAPRFVFRINTFTEGSTPFLSVTFPVRIPDWAIREILNIIKNIIKVKFHRYKLWILLSNIINGETFHLIEINNL